MHVRKRPPLPGFKIGNYNMLPKKEVSMSSALLSRVIEAANFLKIPQTEILEVLKNLGIDDTPEGLMLLDSVITTTDYLEDSLHLSNNSIPILKVKVAVAILKGRDPFVKSEVAMASKKESEGTVTNAIVDALKAQRPIEQLKDKELLELFQEDRDEKIAQELNRRANGMPFIVITIGKTKAGLENINIEATADLLKRARKGIAQQNIVIEGGSVPVYKISELDPESLINEICPICEERDLYRGYCDKCNMLFTGLSDDVQKFMMLVARSSGFSRKTASDRKDLYETAKKGFDALVSEWPSVAKEFKRLQIIDELPKLRRARSTPSVLKDPFYRDSNNNKTF
jgi:hypothetical protein